MKGTMEHMEQMTDAQEAWEREEARAAGELITIDTPSGPKDVLLGEDYYLIPFSRYHKTMEQLYRIIADFETTMHTFDVTEDGWLTVVDAEHLGEDATQDTYDHATLNPEELYLLSLYLQLPQIQKALLQAMGEGRKRELRDHFGNGRKIRTQA